LREIVSGGRVPDHDRVRFDLLRRLGFFVTESSEHVAEYVPWYIKRGQPGLISRFNVPLDEYPRRCRRQIAEWEQLAKTLTDGSARLDVVPSQEYGSAIIEAVTTGEACSVYANVPNTGIISNLPDGCCVEVPCTVDRNGVQPVHVGPLPPQLAALIQTNVSVQGLTVEAALSGRREHIYHAAMLDPHTGSELDLDQIWELVDAMLEVHRDYLPAEFFAAA
jgi:alpha-galactosidase